MNTKSDVCNVKYRFNICINYLLVPLQTNFANKGSSNLSLRGLIGSGIGRIDSG